MSRYRSKILLFLAALSVIALVSACKCSGHDEDVTPSENTSVAFPYVNPPAMLSDDNVAVYCAGHYWDRFACPSWNHPTDSVMIRGVAVRDLEQAMSNYIALLKQIPLDIATSCVSDMTEKIICGGETPCQSAGLDSLGRYFERYCYDPNSPVRDEDLYTPYARAMAENAALSCAQRSRYAEQAASSSLNRRGTAATDFGFMYKNGRTGHLSGIKAPMTLIFFSNPGCQACKEIIDVLSTDPGICTMVEKDSLAIVNIYIDEDMAGWLEYMPVYPEKWHNVFDAGHSVREDELYDVRAIPSLYLLDRDKVVLLKDAPQEEIFMALAAKMDTK